MSDENKSIHEFDFKLICEYYSSLERQGPGSPEITAKDLSFIDNLSNVSRIADIGCGTGGQTRVMAYHGLGHITGIDLFPAFLELFNRNAQKLNLQAAQKTFLEKYAGNTVAEELLANQRHEAELNYKYKQY
jgi:precorrin-6B methylase 2